MMVNMITLIEDALIGSRNIGGVNILNNPIIRDEYYNSKVSFKKFLSNVLNEADGKQVFDSKCIEIHIKKNSIKQYISAESSKKLEELYSMYYESRSNLRAEIDNIIYEAGEHPIISNFEVLYDNKHLSISGDYETFTGKVKKSKIEG